MIHNLDAMLARAKKLAEDNTGGIVDDKRVFRRIESIDDALKVQEVFGVRFRREKRQ